MSCLFGRFPYWLAVDNPRVAAKLAVLSAADLFFCGSVRYSFDPAPRSNKVLTCKYQYKVPNSLKRSTVVLSGQASEHFLRKDLNQFLFPEDRPRIPSAWTSPIMHMSGLPLSFYRYPGNSRRPRPVYCNSYEADAYQPFPMTNATLVIIPRLVEPLVCVIAGLQFTTSLVHTELIDDRSSVMDRS
jgi:hypothetical protein